ncbi:hypothetical protein, partial [Bacteroides fragilis]|uniref:hypothetical protein n=1 Tax=Bacteroides fragilis TaxID=817 RepID=UPI0039F0373F
TKLYYICSVLRISSYDENGIVFLSEGQKNWPKKHQGIDLIFALFIFWIANFSPQFVPEAFHKNIIY